MIQLVGISKGYGARLLFDEVTLSIGKGERLGLVGRNGAGKSTLFKILLSEESYDSGSIQIPKSYRLGSLKQHIKFDHKTVIDECMSILGEEYKYEAYRAEKLLFGLGFTEEDLEKDPHSFSGGYQIRINLVKTLLDNPDCLLLDEPTNYLDIVSLRWLKQFLKSFKGEVVLITHDRDFMDGVVTHTMGISRRKVRKIKGPTSKYYEQLKHEDEIHEKTRVNQEKKVQQMMDYVDKFRAKARGASQAQSKLKMIEKMTVLDELESQVNLNFKFNHTSCPGKIICKVDDVSFGYDEPLFQNINFLIERGDRIGIIGKNGKGKSTLLNVVAGELTKSTGEIWLHNSTQLGHFGQTNVSRLHADNNIIQEIQEENELLTITAVRSICGTMMFGGDDAEKKISVLSGGEKARVLLGKILAKKTNLLFLDEPTNHLDMESIGSLIEAIQEYEGACLIVTHSEEILRKCVNKLVIFRNGGAEFFDGNYDEFLEKIGWDTEETTGDQISKPIEVDHIEKKKNINPQAQALRIKEVEEQIGVLENYQGLLEKNLEVHSHKGQVEDLKKCTEDLKTVQDKIDNLFKELESLY